MLFREWALFRETIVINKLGPNAISDFVSCKRAPPVVNIHVCHNVVPVVESTCFLGVTISCDFKWNTHITNTCTKARQQLGLLYCLFGIADPARSSLRMSHLPTLDYCSVVWDPAAAYLINKLESVQRLAARLTIYQALVDLT